jgi:hypothetical protein
VLLKTFPMFILISRLTYINRLHLLSSRISTSVTLFCLFCKGAVATAARTILESLDRIPNEENRTKIGFITVDTSLHFYSLNVCEVFFYMNTIMIIWIIYYISLILQSNASVPQMLVVSDLEDVFLPQPDDLLVNLTESRAVVESLLRSLGDMFKDTQTVGNALGSALLAGYKLIVCIDKIFCLFCEEMFSPVILIIISYETLSKLVSNWWKNCSIAIKPTKY